MAQVGEIPLVSMLSVLPGKLVTRNDTTELLIHLNAGAGIQFADKLCERCVDSFPAFDVAVPYVLVDNEEDGYMVRVPIVELSVFLSDGHSYLGNVIGEQIECVIQCSSCTANAVTELVWP